MAFPLTPTNGQTYNNYVYNSVSGTWKYNSQSITGTLTNTIVNGSNLFLKKSSGGSIAFNDGLHDNSLIESGSSSNDNRLEFWTNTVTNSGLVERMRIDSSGHIGIGTVSSTAPLFVAGTDSGQEQLRLGHSNGASYWGFGRDNVTTGDFIINNGGGEKIRISSSGNLGIGTSSPSTPIQIGQATALAPLQKSIQLSIMNPYSNSNLGSQYSVIGFYPTTMDTSDISTQTGGEALKNFYVGTFADQQYFNGNRFSIAQGGKERFTIGGYSSPGNIGIGTSNPYAKTEIRLTGTVSAVTAWSSLGGNGSVVLSDNSSSLGSKMGIVGCFNPSTGGIGSSLIFGREGSAWGTYAAIHTHPNNANTSDSLVERLRVNSDGRTVLSNISNILPITWAGVSALNTGISINAFDGGGVMLVIASRNTASGINTQSAMYHVHFYYDGNNAPPAAIYISGTSNFLTFGVSGDNALTITNSGGGNCYCTLIGKFS